MSHSELPPPPTEPPPGRQSGIPPSGGLGNFGIPGAGLIVPPALPPSPAAPDGVLTGSVRVLDPPAELPSAAARPAAADKLPGGIGGPNLRAAAANGDPAAEYEIAARFADGRGVPQDLTAAAEWFERAGNGGLIPAQFRLGGLYEKALGVKKDLERARRLYTTAAEAGHAKAMHNLAVLYAEGIDGKPDYQSAAKWFRKAAEHGVSDSQYNLGVLYTRGIGIEANLTEAYKWFTLAARDGDKDAAAKRDEVGSRIDPQALMALRAAAQVWTPAQQPDAAVQVKAPAGGWDTAAAPAPAVRRVGPRVEAGQRLAQ